MGRKLWCVLFLAMVVVRLRGAEGGGAAAAPIKNEGKSNGTRNEVVVNEKRKNNGGGSGGGGGGGVGWGWGGGGGGGNRQGGWGWGNGGGGGVFWRWGCSGKHPKPGMNRVFSNEDYKIGEFAQCVKNGRCKGMKLDCPLHCGGPCVYDCKNMCKAHCKR